MKENTQFTMDFPVGLMERPTPDLNYWIAKGVLGTVTFDGPDGSTWTLAAVIPDTIARVQPILGTGTVDAFAVAFTLTKDEKES